MLNFKTELKAYKKANHLGLKMQLLPDKLCHFYNHTLFRLFRVLGGISAILVLFNYHISLTFLFQFLVLGFKEIDLESPSENNVFASIQEM